MLEKILKRDWTLTDFIYLPKTIRWALYFLLFLLFFCIGYWFFIRDQIVALNVSVQKEQYYKDQISHKLLQLAQNDQYRIQVTQLQKKFDDLTAQFPKLSEMPALVDEITTKALDAGLEFQLIRPLKATKADFYTILPVEVVVEGTYNQIGRFIYGIAAMKQIITVSDFILKPTNVSNHLIFRLNIMTYHYMPNQTQASNGVKNNE